MTLKTIARSAVAALILSAGTASATAVCGGVTYPDRTDCPVVDPTPDILPPVIAEGGTSFSAAATEARAAARAQARAAQRQRQAQRQQQTATGGKASVVTGDDVLSQALRNAITINNGGQVASSAIAAACNGSVEGGCMSAAVQVAGWGVSVNAGKGFVGHHIPEAEDRYKRGDPALMVYLSRFDKNAEGAFRDLGWITGGQK